MAFKNFQAPADGSGFVSQFLDCAFNVNLFLWDTAFQTMFLNVAHPLVPGISSLDNFYIKQYSTGEICREINRTTGIDFDPWRNNENLPLFSRWGFDEYFNQYKADVIYKGRATPTPNPKLTLDALNHPILAWAELESYKWTGDKARLELVRLPLIKYYEALKKYIRQEMDYTLQIGQVWIIRQEIFVLQAEEQESTFPQRWFSLQEIFLNYLIF